MLSAGARPAHPGSSVEVGVLIVDKIFLVQLTEVLLVELLELLLLLLQHGESDVLVIRRARRLPCFSQGGRSSGLASSSSSFSVSCRSAGGSAAGGSMSRPGLHVEPGLPLYLRRLRLSDQSAGKASSDIWRRCLLKLCHVLEDRPASIHTCDSGPRSRGRSRSASGQVSLVRTASSISSMLNRLPPPSLGCPEWLPPSASAELVPAREYFRVFEQPVDVLQRGAPVRGARKPSALAVFRNSSIAGSARPILP